MDPFSVPIRTVFRYSHRFYFFLVLPWILPFFGAHIDWTLFWYSSEQFFDTRTDSTFSLYSPGFFHFSVHSLIGPFSSTHPNSFSIRARILPFPGARTDSTNFRYAHLLDTFPVLIRTVIRYSHEFYFFLVLIRILPFFATHIDWTLLRYSPEQVLDTGMDSTFSWYSLGFCHF